MSRTFGFGKNWLAYASSLEERNVKAACSSLRERLGSLEGRTFLDVGCGSGLSSLAAVLLGATRVLSLDYDEHSVLCTEMMRKRFAPDSNWNVQRGSALDEQYLASLGKFDVVYSWGVLHHTGNMWKALENVLIPLADDGTIFISIYNDQGFWSKFWLRVKVTYNILPGFIQPLYVLLVAVPREAMAIAHRPIAYWTRLRDYHQLRGMSRWHDMVDWVGGFPFEVAMPERIFEFYHNRGLSLVYLKTCAGGLGCNEFIFQRRKIDRDSS